MRIPAVLAPTAVEHFSLASGAAIDIPKATLQFSAWLGPAIPSTYGGKAVVEYNGRPAFAELAVLWTLLDAGWDGCWVTHGRKRHIYRVGLMHENPSESIPPALEQVLTELRGVLGTGAGAWDIAVERDSSVLFVECKRLRRDAIRTEQVAWLEAALRIGVPIESFLVAEWDLDGTLPATPQVSPAGGSAAKTLNSPRVSPSAAPSADVVIEGAQVPTTDVDYYRWLQAHPNGYVLSVTGRRQPKLHKAQCGNIRTHNNPGAMTERGSRKICSDSKSVLRDWLGANGFSRIADKCGTCGA